MEENNRINRRTRPRPYDLRRKVLLKNFMREQMTYIPETRGDLLSQNNDVSITDSSVSTSVDCLLELKDENESSSNHNFLIDQKSIDLFDTDSIQLDSKDNITKTNNPTNDKNATNDPLAESGVFKFTRLMKFKRESKKTLKSIFKAKQVVKSVKTSAKTDSFKRGIERVFSFRNRSKETLNQIPKSNAKSPSFLFKYQRQPKSLKNVDKMKRSSYINLSEISDSGHRTVNQSVQTDDSWTREELSRVEQSNKRLREENRLLADSLSYLISSPSSEIKNCSSPLQSSNKNTNSLVYPDYYIASSNTSNNWSPRPRVSRSKSVHEYNEKKNVLRNNYCTRSMSFHNYRNNFSSCPGYQGINRIRSIQRRSSMPERVLSENDRTMVCRRSGSVRDTRSRRPLNSLPSEAFY